MTEGLQSKVCVVTGASSGIGEATARRLAGAGASVALVARRGDRLESLAKEIEKDGGKALPIKCDITDEGEARAALEQAQWKLDQKTVMSTRDGVIVDTLYREGEFVKEGNPVVRMLPPANVKVRFFVPQALVGAIAPGRAASVSCDGCAAPVPVTVSYVSTEAEYTPPVIYSNETRSKLVFLVEARPSVADASKLRPGQPVSVALQ